MGGVSGIYGSSLCWGLHFILLLLFLFSLLIANVLSLMVSYRLIGGWFVLAFLFLLGPAQDPIQSNSPPELACSKAPSSLSLPASPVGLAQPRTLPPPPFLILAHFTCLLSSACYTYPYSLACCTSSLGSACYTYLFSLLLPHPYALSLQVFFNCSPNLTKDSTCGGCVTC